MHEVHTSGATGDYMKDIAEATDDIDVSLLFNNAGYIIMGVRPFRSCWIAMLAHLIRPLQLFADTPLERQLKNYDVNATCAVKITHHFLSRMISKKLRGAISFTSSPAGTFDQAIHFILKHSPLTFAAGLMPCPFSVMYGATKAFLTEFATSLACEVKSKYSLSFLKAFSHSRCCCRRRH